MNRFRPGGKVKEPMSPGVEGARQTCPPLRWAVKVLMKDDSPPIIRRIPPKMPPPAEPVFISTPSWATMAPGSALMLSPASNATVSMA